MGMPRTACLNAIADIITGERCYLGQEIDIYQKSYWHCYTYIPLAKSDLRLRWVIAGVRNPKFSLKEYFFKRVVLPFKEYFGHKIKNILIRDILQSYTEFFKNNKALSYQ